MPRLELGTVDLDVPEMRRARCSFVTLRPEGWGDNVFHLWMPEHIAPFWNSCGPGKTTQDFEPVGEGCVHWRTGNTSGFVDFELKAEPSLATVTAVVENTGDKPLTSTPACCLQSWPAPDFYNPDCSQIWAQLDGKWRPLIETDLASRSYLAHGRYLRAGAEIPSRPKAGAKPDRPRASRLLKELPHEAVERARREAADQVAADPRFERITEAHCAYLIECKTRGVLIGQLSAEGKHVSHMETSQMPERATHPLFCFVSADGARAVGTCCDDYQGLFHNNDPWIGCLHAGPVAREVPPGGQETFTQWIFFSDTGLSGCIEACRDVTGHAEG